MTPAKIRAKYHRHRDRIAVIRAEAQGRCAVEGGHIAGLQAICKHPEGYATSCMGDPGYHCPDCGLSR